MKAEVTPVPKATGEETKGTPKVAEAVKENDRHKGVMQQLGFLMTKAKRQLV